MNDNLENGQEALWAVCNATQNKDPQHVSCLIQKGAFEALIKMMEIADVNAIIVAIEGLRNIFDTGKDHFIDEEGQNQLTLVFEQRGGVDCLEKLQQHKNNRVYEQAVRLLEDFFVIEKL